MNNTELRRIIATLHKAGIIVSQVDGQLKTKSKKGAFTPALIQLVKDNKDHLIRFLSEQQEQGGSVTAQTIRPYADRDGLQPLSFAQHRLWFIDKLQQGSANYNIPLALKVFGDFDVDIAQQALNRIIERHQVLRTVYRETGQGPMQRVTEQSVCPMQRVDLSGLDHKSQQLEVDKRIADEFSTSFDLSSDVMVRASFILLSTEPGQRVGVLLFNMHHIASDGWSMGLLMNEFVQQYQALQNGLADPLPQLPIQYLDYALYQREHVNDAALEKQLDYWQRQLADAPAVHSLPLDFRRKEQLSRPGGVVTFAMDAGTSENATKLAQRHGVTPFMLFHGVLSLVLARHANNEDVVVGTSVANRMHTEVESLIGFFVNTLVLRVACDEQQTLGEYLGQIKKVNLGAQSHQDIPFEQLVEVLNVQRSNVHSPLFQVMYTMDNNQHSELALPGLRFESLAGGELEAKFELSVAVGEHGGTWSVEWVYDKTLFKAQTVERLARHFNRLVEQMVEQPEAPLNRLQMLGEDEIDCLLNRFNRPPMGYPTDRSVHRLFEQTVQKYPNQVAMICDDQQMTYDQLNRRANRLAHLLMTLGVGSQTPVGLSIGRSFDMVVAILAIIKAGGAYVPIDPKYPESRVNYMIEDTGLKVLLTHKGVLTFLSDEDAVKRVVLDEDSFNAQLAHFSDADPCPSVEVEPNHLLYIIYTSGSTGQPKGVMTPHLGVVRLVANCSFVSLDSHSSVLMCASISFDAATFELWGMLLNGGCIVLYPDEQFELQRLNGLLRQHRVKQMWLTTGLFDLWVATAEDLPDLRWVGTGGQKINPPSVATLRARLPHVTIGNDYGPTEATTFAVTHNIAPEDSVEGPIPIGKGISGTLLYVMSSPGVLSPLGCIGELYIGGDGLALGYLNKPDMDAKAFIANPFGPGRLYRTGDLVYYSDEGQMYCLGRRDNQVKIRGFRIEPGEIEQRLQQCADIEVAVVSVREDTPGQPRLVAYVQLKPDASLADIRAQMADALPQYMQPSAYVTMTRWPHMANGKIDAKALPPPKDIDSAEQQYVAPKSDTEKQLVAIWSDLLNLPGERLGITANFFELGGHSLLSIRVVAEIRARLDVEVPVRALFDQPTIEGLARLIDNSGDEALRPAVVAVERGDRLPLSFAQRRLWFIDQLQGGSANYNIPVVLTVRGSIDVASAELALQTIVERHEVLRTTYHDGADEGCQAISDRADFILEVVDLSLQSPSEQSLNVRRLAGEDAAKAFDLSCDLMLRARWLVLDQSAGQEKGVLLLNMHHIASDGWSMGVLVREFAALYEAFVQGRPNPLPPLAIQYGDYALWQLEYMQGAVLERQLAYWSAQLYEAPVVHSLPLDYPRRAEGSGHGAMVSGHLDKTCCDELVRLAQRQGVTPFILLHSVFALLLARHGHNDDVVVGTPVANRMQQELEPLIGYFVNTLVLRTRGEEHARFCDYLEHVRQLNLDAQAHQDIPFEMLVERLNIPRHTEHTPLFQIMFTLDTLAVSPPTIAELQVDMWQDEADSAVAAKFELSLDALMSDDGLTLHWTYDSGLFAAATIERLNQHMMHLLRSVVATPDAAMSQLTLMDSEETRRLLERDTQIAAQPPMWRAVDELFSQIAAKQPSEIALIDGQAQYDYRQLEQQSNALAAYLKAQEIGRGALLGLATERSVHLLVGLLAILKCGAGYVPLDPEYPSSRLAHMIEDSALSVILTESSLAERFSAGDRPCLNLDELSALPIPSSQPNDAASERDADDIAYVIYTSGSTGKPKGVMVSHRNWLSYLSAATTKYAIEGGQRVLQFSSISFDIFIEELSLSLLGGGTLVINAKGAMPDVADFWRLIRRHSIDIVSLPTAYWQQLCVDEQLAQDANSSPLKVMIVGGEAMTRQYQQRWMQQVSSGCRLFNTYGPTEGTVIATAFDASRYVPDGNGIPIGGTLDNGCCLILDRFGHPVPDGCVGELYLGGYGVALGYLNLPQMTEERFIDNPTTMGPKTLYRTGDLVRRRNDGELEFVARVDEQVKIRGFRIEPGEIEHQLEQLPGVRDCLVVVQTDDNGVKRLVCYVRPAQSVPQDWTAKLHDGLSKVLPQYMLPVGYAVLEQWPLTVNGKLDKRALPPVAVASAHREYQAPENDTERALVSIWSSLLHIESDKLSVTANFFDLGGHSLLSVRMISEIRARMSVEVAIRALFDHPTIAGLASHIQQQAQQALRPPIRALEHQGPVPLSFAQQRLWFIHQLQGGSANYNMPFCLKLSGPLCVPSVERALQHIVERHQILRTVYRTENDTPVQLIREGVRFQLKVVDLTSLDEQEKQDTVRRLAAEDAALSFDLTSDLMLRVCWLPMAEDVGVLLFNMHHIASDGWSIEVLMAEFAACYQAELAQKIAVLDPLPIQYADYALWQRDYVSGEVLKRQLAYWQAQLSDAPAIHSLPLDYPRPSQATFDGDIVEGGLDGAMAAKIRRLAAENGVTPFMLVHAAFSVVLARHSNNHDVVIGTVVANRLQSELTSLIGFFVNTLVLRTQCDFNIGFGDYLKQVKQVNLDAQTYQDLPFESLVEHLQVPRTQLHSPLFQILYTLDESSGMTQSAAPSLEGLEIEALSSEVVSTKFDLTLNAEIGEQGLSLNWTYNTALFKRDSIERLNRHLETLLVAVCQGDDRATGRLPMLDETETHELVVGLNQTSAPFDQCAVVHQWVNRQAQMMPHNIAVVMGDKSLSYAELDRQSNQIAHLLCASGVGPDVMVGICMNRSIAMIVSLLAVLKAGGAYVPLVPSLPQARLKFMIEDTAMKHLLVGDEVMDRLTLDECIQTFVFNSDGQLPEAHGYAGTLPVVAALTSRHLAYVIYTSGTTGQPKGVLLEHRGLVNMAGAIAECYGLNPDSRVLQIASFGFDAATFDWALALTRGATLYLIDEQMLLEPERLGSYVERQKITFAFIPPALLAVLDPVCFESVQTICCGGEALAPAVAKTWCTGRALYNGYGPTENTCISTQHRITDAKGAFNIGRPYDNVQCLVLDENLQLVPKGSVGELFLGGVGLARGYLNRPDMTASHFVANPFSADSGARLYRTGDLVRYTDQGELIFLGRADNQVKIRGLRIELDEIEQQLNALAEVGSALVVEFDNSKGKALAAYIVPKASERFTATDEQRRLGGLLREKLKSILPEYMVPSAFVIVQRWPLTANGKIDKRALPQPESSFSQSDYVAPSGWVQAQLVSLWAKTLNIDESRLGVNDNFFALGGHSLLVNQLVQAVNRALGCRLSLSDVFANQSIAQLSQVITQQAGNEQQVPIEPTDRYEPFVRLKDGEPGVDAIFLVHPIGGNSYCYAPLAPLIDYPGPIYGINSPSQGHESVVAAAAFYIEQIKRQHPQDGYVLGGWSVGGVIAAEMASQLEQSQQRVVQLWLIDAFNPVYQSVEKIDRLELLGVLAAELGIDVQDPQLADVNDNPEMSIDELIGRLLTVGIEQGRLPSLFEFKQMKQRFELLEKGWCMLLNYIPSEFSGNAKLVVSEQDVAVKNNGWDDVLKLTEVSKIPGGHFDIVRAPNVKTLAQVLTDYLR